MEASTTLPPGAVQAPDLKDITERIRLPRTAPA
jgi:hypothetical protein